MVEVPGGYQRTRWVDRADVDAVLVQRRAVRQPPFRRRQHGDRDERAQHRPASRGATDTHRRRRVEAGAVWVAAQEEARSQLSPGCCLTS